MAKDKPCCPDCAEKEARSAVMARYQDGGPVLPDLDRERRANFFRRAKKAEARPLSPSDPLFIQEDESLSPAALSDMQRAEIQFDPSLTEKESTLDSVLQRARDVGQGFADIPGFVGNYFVRPDERGQPSLVSPTEVASDALSLGQGMVTSATEDPVSFALDMIPGVSNVRSLIDSNALYQQATELEESGDALEAAKTRSLASMSMTDVFNPIPGSRTAIRGIIAGSAAQRAPQRLGDQRLSQIEETGDKGLERQVFQETGAFISPEGKYQFEIDTTDASTDVGKWATMYQYMGSADQVSTYLPDVLELPELYENYPQLKEIKVTLDTSLPGSAQYNVRRNTISLNPAEVGADEKAIVSSLLHETQHAVQNIENYLAQQLFPEDLMSFEEYRRLPVEVEARNVQSRYENPELRGDLPTLTQEFKPEEYTDVSELTRRDAARAFQGITGLGEFDDIFPFSKTDSQKIDETMARILERIKNQQNTGRTRGQAIEQNPNITGVNKRSNPNNPERN